MIDNINVHSKGTYLPTIQEDETEEFHISETKKEIVSNFEKNEIFHAMYLGYEAFQIDKGICSIVSPELLKKFKFSMKSTKSLDDQLLTFISDEVDACLKSKTSFGLNFTTDYKAQLYIHMYNLLKNR